MRGASTAALRAVPAETLAAPTGAVSVLASPDAVGALRGLLPGLTDLTGRAVHDIAAAYGGGVLLIEQGVPGWDQLLLMLAVEKPDAKVIVISDNLPVHMVRTLMKLAAFDVLPPSASQEEVTTAMLRLVAAASDGAPPVGEAQCWAFRGAVGGAGATTLAIESAFALARLAGRDKVCLVDLNFADGMISAFLESVPKLDLDALSAAPERLDQRLLAAWCAPHEGGISIISAPRNPDADSLGTQAAVLRLLDVACSVYPFILIDMPRHMTAWTKMVVGAVDEMVIVSELTVPSLHAAADICRDYDLLRGERTKARLVLNRMFKTRQMRAGFDVAKAEKAIERKIDRTITSDWDAARLAVNLGKPIADVKPKSPLVTDVDALARAFLPANLLEKLLLQEAGRGKRRRIGQ